MRFMHASEEKLGKSMKGEEYREAIFRTPLLYSPRNRRKETFRAKPLMPLEIPQ